MTAAAVADQRHLGVVQQERAQQRKKRSYGPVLYKQERIAVRW